MAAAVGANGIGIAVGTLGLTFGVLVEAFYAHLAARALVRDKFGPSAPPGTAPNLSYGELVRFHTPLAASTLLYLLAQPLVAAALAPGAADGDGVIGEDGVAVGAAVEIGPVPSG